MSLTLEKANHLALWSDLTYLKFHEVTPFSSNSFKFPNVTILEVHDTSWAGSSSTIINSTTFPALSALSFSFTYQSELSTTEVFQSVGSQLGAFFTDWSGFPEDQIGHVQDKTLFDVYLPSLTSLPRVKYLSISAAYASPSKVLGDLLKLLRQSSLKVKPSLIYLPSEIDLNLSPQNKVYVELQGECEKAGIEIVLEEQAGNWRLDSTISDDFWARMKKAKREKRLTESES